MLKSGEIMGKSCIESAKFDSSESIKVQRFHRGAEIILIEKGDIKITARDNVFFAGAGSLVFLDNLEECKVEVVSPEYERFCIFLKDLSVFKELVEPELLLYLRKNCSQNNRTVSLGSERRKLAVFLKKS